MVNKELEEYIKTQLGGGFTRDQVKQKLTEAGYQENDIDEAMNPVGVEVSPAAVPAGHTRAETIAKLTKTSGHISGWTGIMQALPFTLVAVLLGIFLLYMHVAWYYGVGCILAGILYMVIRVVQAKRMASVDLSSRPLEAQENPRATLEQDEKVRDYIAGIMRTDFKVRSVEVMGAGEIKTPENAMVITDRHVLLITVPLPGAEKTIGGTDIGMWQWMAARKDIENKLKEMLSNMPVQAIAQSNPKNYALDLNDIKKVGAPRFQQTIAFTTRDNKKYSYSIRDKQDFLKAKNIFAGYF